MSLLSGLRSAEHLSGFSFGSDDPAYGDLRFRHLFPAQPARQRDAHRISPASPKPTLVLGWPGGCNADNEQSWSNPRSKDLPSRVTPDPTPIVLIVYDVGKTLPGLDRINQVCLRKEESKNNCVMDSSEQPHINYSDQTATRDL